MLTLLRQGIWNSTWLKSSDPKCCTWQDCLSVCIEFETRVVTIGQYFDWTCRNQWRFGLFLCLYSKLELSFAFDGKRKAESQSGRVKAVGGTGEGAMFFYMFCKLYRKLIDSKNEVCAFGGLKTHITIGCSRRRRKGAVLA